MFLNRCNIKRPCHRCERLGDKDCADRPESTRKRQHVKHNKKISNKHRLPPPISTKWSKWNNKHQQNRANEPEILKQRQRYRNSRKRGIDHIEIEKPTICRKKFIKTNDNSAKPMDLFDLLTMPKIFDLSTFNISYIQDLDKSISNLCGNDDSFIIRLEHDALLKLRTLSINIFNGIYIKSKYVAISNNECLTSRTIQICLDGLLSSSSSSDTNNSNIKEYVISKSMKSYDILCYQETNLFKDIV